MAITALQAAASGMKALDVKLDVLANNLANINTTGFKRSRTNFEDLLYQIKREPGILNANNKPTPHGIVVGVGVAVAGTQLDFEQGTLDQTYNGLDMAIQGEGFFQVRTINDGQEVIAFTRAGNFTINRDGDIVLGNSDGPLMEPNITLPADAKEISVSADGRVMYKSPGDQALQEAGQILLARFVNPEGLKQIGKNLYIDTDASGTSVPGQPQTDGFGDIRGGALEMSNVEPVRELIELIKTQRGFELNSQSIKSADESLQVVTNLRRF
ncbi:MAG: flagellar basal-body rod protein FlgG [Planctomycetota bacterium]|nr:flagellar basal-body rod protein FlgG [Planctomycetota bacterium]